VSLHLLVSWIGRKQASVQGGQNASDDICSCDFGPARSHFRRFAGNPDRPASGRSCERCRCGERHAGACVRLALPSITSLASLVLPASSALKSMSEHRTCSRGSGPPKAAASRRPDHRNINGYHYIVDDRTGKVLVLAPGYFCRASRQFDYRPMSQPRG
jgi:hypothetical protein